METITTSKKIELELFRQGRKKTWLAAKLNISRPTLNKKMKDNYFTNEEIRVINSLL